MNGERAPSEVYKDFQTTVLDILGADENQEALLNGVAGMGKGLNDIPGSIVSVETAPSQHKNVTALSETPENVVTRNANFLHPNNLMGQNLNGNHVPVTSSFTNFPPIIWIIGGPGSNKATLCLKAIGLNPGWGHFRYLVMLYTIKFFSLAYYLLFFVLFKNLTKTKTAILQCWSFIKIDSRIRS